MEKKILVTGASGFIGSFLVEGALERGMQVWAGVRKSSSRKYLQDPRIHFAVLDFTDSDRLASQLEEQKRQHGKFILHRKILVRYSWRKLPLLRESDF